MICACVSSDRFGSVVDDPPDFFRQISHYSGMKEKNGPELSFVCHGQCTQVAGSNLADSLD